jgi:putative hemolysin
MTFDLLVILLLLVANGICAMAEIALVASRQVRLEQRAAEGSAGAAAAVHLKTNSTDFLSTVQVGITLIGIVAGAYSGSRLADPLAVMLAPLPIVGEYAPTFALAVVVAALTYFSLVIGELVPKAIALGNPERVVALVARPFTLLARAASPAVRLLSASTRGFLWVLRIKPASDPHPTEEEIRALIKQAARTGEVQAVEQEIVDKVFRLGDRRVASLMTPRWDVDWIDVQQSDEALRSQLGTQHHSRILACDGDLDRIIGVVDVEDLLGVLLRTGQMDLRSIARQPVFVPETVTAFALLERFRAERSHTGIVVDEYGTVQGVVTMTDLLEGLLGDVPDRPVPRDASIVRRGDGSWLVDGDVSLDELRTVLALPDVQAEEVTPQVHTIAGLLMTRLARLPVSGDIVTWRGHVFEVVDMDGRRVDKVLVTADTTSAVNPGEHE